MLIQTLPLVANPCASLATPQVCVADNWITCHFNDQTSTMDNVDAFTSLWRPSCTTLRDAEWIAVNRGMNHSSNPPLIEEMKAAFEILAQSHRKDGNITLTVSALDQLAHRFNVTSGKWLVFTDLSTADASWAEIVKLVCLRRGKGFAKVSVNKNENHHVVCVYVDDFSDEVEVKKLREDLRSIGVVKKIGFKLDAYSHLGIYARNMWGISPNRYYE